MSAAELVVATFRHITPSDELMTRICEEADHMRSRYPDLHEITVTIESSRHHSGHFCACVEITPPGAPALVARARARNPHQALYEVFRLAEHAVRAHDERCRGEAGSRAKGGPGLTVVPLELPEA